MASGPTCAERCPDAATATTARSVSRMARGPSEKSCPASGSGTQARSSVPFHTIGTSRPLAAYPSVTLATGGRIPSERNPVPAPAPGRWDAGRVGTVRALEPDDWDDWRALWAGYLAFYRAELPDPTSRATFERLCCR